MPKEIFDELYFGHNGRKEFFLIDNKNFYSYDITHRKKKLIIEYDGEFWHPTYFEGKIYPKRNEIHPILKVTHEEIWDKDQKKKNYARQLGFNVFTIRKNWTDEDDIIKRFIEECLNER